MKKLTITLFFVAIACIGFAQKDSTNKKDTSFVPMYQMNDTIKVHGALVTLGNDVVHFISPAFVLRTGFAILSKDKKSFERKGDWSIFGILDSKKNKISLINLIQIVQ